MGAPLLRHRFRFDEDAGTTDATTGVHTETASAVCSRRVAFLPAADGALVALRARYPSLEFGLAGRSDATLRTVRAGHIAVGLDLGRRFEVLGAVDPDGRQRWVHLALREQGVPGVVST